MARPEVSIDLLPFAAASGIELVSSSAGEVVGRVAWSEARCTSGGVMHGGLLMTLADSTGAVCAFLNLPEGARGTATIESKTNLCRPVTSGVVTATSVPLHVGRTTILVQTTVRDEQERLVSITLQTQAVLAGG
jgi:1,4-dihydroxy-2-naphthoyl-CoA hydrolase